MSLYGDYIKERANKGIVENDKGFATYAFFQDGSVYLEDIYVVPEHRKSGVATELANEVARIAKEKGCTKMIGSVVPSAQNSTASLFVLISYGMRLKSSSNDFIVFEKELV